MKEFYDLIVCYYKAATEEHHYFHDLKNCYEWIKEDMKSCGYNPYHTYEEVDLYMKSQDVYRCGDGDYIIVRCLFED